jgi:hypothetical protein
VAIGAQVIVVLIGVSLGIVSGFFGGWIDYIIMRIVDALYSLPSLLVAVLVMSFCAACLRSRRRRAPSIWVRSTRRPRIAWSLHRVVRHALADRVSVGPRSGDLDQRTRVRDRGARRGRGSTATDARAPSATRASAALVAISFGIPASRSPRSEPELSGYWGYSADAVVGTMIAESLPRCGRIRCCCSGGGCAALTLLAFTYVGDALRDALDR